MIGLLASSNECDKNKKLDHIMKSNVTSETESFAHQSPAYFFLSNIKIRGIIICNINYTVVLVIARF